MEEVFYMSAKELDRINILQKILNKELTQVKAAELLSIGDRQIRNLITQYKKHGVKGIISKKRGAPGNRTISEELKSSIMALVREKYEDFGPTFAAEKLKELDNKTVSKETLRQWMIEAHLWIPNRKTRKEHNTRRRRECFGELCQADGSIHHWFGEDLPKANATVLVDDATGIVTSIFFSESETLEAYYKAFELHFKCYGRPRAFYTDRYSVFQANNKIGITNMQHSLKALDIQLILANSPQAKGRVERVNRTLQDRLIKEFRLRGIRSIKDANEFMSEFLKAFNRKFSKKPMSDVDAHRPLDGYDLDRLLRRFEDRTLLSGAIFQYKKSFYKVQTPEGVSKMKGRKVEVREIKPGKLRVFMGNQELEVEKVENIISTPEEMSRKEVLVWKDDRRSPSKKHTRMWRKFKITCPYSRKAKENEGKVL